MSMHSGRLTIFQAGAVDDPQLGHAAFRVLACLGTYSDKDGWCYPSQATLAARLRITRQAVSKSIQQLAALGYLTIRQQYNADGGKRPSLYRLSLDRLEPMQPHVDTHATPHCDHATSEVDTHATSEVAYNVPSERPRITPQRTERSPRQIRPTIDTYQPGDALLEALGAERPDLNLALVADLWRDYHRERGTVIKDYDASLRRWIRNERARPRAPNVRATHTTGFSSDDAFAKNIARLKAVGRQP